MSEYMRRIDTIHFVGIGGVGLGGIAAGLFTLGCFFQGAGLRAHHVAPPPARPRAGPHL